MTLTLSLVSLSSCRFFFMRLHENKLRLMKMSCYGTNSCSERSAIRLQSVILHCNIAKAPTFKQTRFCLYNVTSSVKTAHDSLKNSRNQYSSRSRGLDLGDLPWKLPDFLEYLRSSEGQRPPYLYGMEHAVLHEGNVSPQSARKHVSFAFSGPKDYGDFKAILPTFKVPLVERLARIKADLLVCWALSYFYCLNCLLRYISSSLLPCNITLCSPPMHS